MRVLVTGAGGMLGSALVQVARESSWDVVPAYRTRPRSLPPGIEVDLTQAGAAAALRASRPDLVVNCAAITDVDWCEKHPEETRLVNADVPARLAQLTAEADIPLIQISTDSVFDGRRGNYSELDAPNPLNIYAAAKLDAETAVLSASDRHLVVRTNLFGVAPAHALRLGLASWLIQQLANGRPVRGFRDALFSPLYVGDLSRLVLRAARIPLAGLFHLGSSASISKLDFAFLLADRLDLDRSLIYAASMADLRFAAARPRDTSMDSSAIAEWLGPLPEVADGVERLKRSLGAVRPPAG